MAEVGWVGIRSKKIWGFFLSMLNNFYFLYSEKFFVETEDAEPQGPPKMDLWSRQASSDLVKVIF